MRPFQQQMIVERAEHRTEGEGIVPFPDSAVILRAQPVVERRGAIGQQQFEEPGGIAAFEQAGGFAVRADQPQCRRPGHERADRQAGAGDVRAEDRERIRVARRRDIGDVTRGSPPDRRTLNSQTQSSRNVGTCQISLAYSRIARSDENQPMPAVFSRLVRHQAV